MLGVDGVNSKYLTVDGNDGIVTCEVSGIAIITTSSSRKHLCSFLFITVSPPYQTLTVHIQRVLVLIFILWMLRSQTMSGL